MAEKIDFKSWWDKKYFNVSGHYALLYKTYKLLHKAGADLDYVEAF